MTREAAARLLLVIAFASVAYGVFLVAGLGWTLIVGGVLATVFAVTIDVDGGRDRG